MSGYDPRTPSTRPLDYVEFGPGLGSDVDRRLIGDARGKRVLDLGCGAGHTAVGLAERGARVIATDNDPGQLFSARALAQRSSVTVEFHEAGPAELAFIRADQIDIAVSVWALSLVDDLDRVFRQVHRVLRPNAHLIVAEATVAIEQSKVNFLDDQLACPRHHFVKRRGLCVKC